MTDEDIKTTLGGFAGLTALIGNRVHPLTLPQGSTIPAVTYQKISGGQDYNLDGFSGLENPRYQFDIYSTSFLGSKNIAAQLHLAMEAATLFKAILISDFDNYDPTQGFFRITQDFSIWRNQ